VLEAERDTLAVEYVTTLTGALRAALAWLEGTNE